MACGTAGLVIRDLGENQEVCSPSATVAGCIKRIKKKIIMIANPRLMCFFFYSTETSYDIVLMLNFLSRVALAFST